MRFPSTITLINKYSRPRGRPGNSRSLRTADSASSPSKDAGLGHFPSYDFAVNAAWLTAAMTGQILLAWLKLLALDGDLAKAEPKTLRHRMLHTAARLARGGRKRHLRIQATWPWAETRNPGHGPANRATVIPDAQRQPSTPIKDQG
jgi:hypothetical protein